MSQAQFIQARELIKQKRFDDARALLREIDHPTAREWLAKLDQIAPPTTASSAPPTPSSAPTTPQEQLKAARDLLAAKRYDEARILLFQIDHPIAQQWLTKLSQIAPIQAPTPGAASSVPPRTAGAASSAVPPTPDPAHDYSVREAQRLLLKGDYDRARELLESLHTLVAAFWLDKTAVNQFRSHENLWLDMFRYTPPSGVDPAWRCPVCGRSPDQMPLCPQRGQPECPVQLEEREIEEPRRLALILEALQHDQTQNIGRLAGSPDVGRLERWREALQWQFAHLQEPDIRRPAIEAGITLLGQLVEKRRA